MTPIFLKLLLCVDSLIGHGKEKHH